ncbi:MAG TPA: Txe/YoeB family addiction module toxin [Candidatus Kapabacteria bacterium]|nr:Txe/YoeB family addiction module toxin [Candidatus Kapabacteria bacterium]
MRHELRFHRTAQEELEGWRRVSPTVFRRIGELIKSIDETPDFGIGRPEALQREWKGFWSRRITKKDRLIYRVQGKVIEIASCKFHYDDK